MRNIHPLAGLSALALLSMSTAVVAHADTVTVNATDVIYAAGTQSSVASSAGGTVPSSVSVSGLNSLTFSVSGTVIMNAGTGDNSNDADGAGAAVASSSSTGSGSLSGITLPGAGDLVGVFLAPGGPSGSAPTALNFVGATNFASLSPALDQVFFIGDGLTGDGTGSTQIFNVPTGASQLYLGIADACGYNGAPGCYSDNRNSFSVITSGSPTATPEPSSWLLFGTGALGLFSVLALRRRSAVFQL